MSNIYHTFILAACDGTAAIWQRCRSLGKNRIDFTAVVVVVFVGVAATICCIVAGRSTFAY